MSENDNTLHRGDSFEAHSDPNTDLMVVIKVEDISGYRSAYVAERNSNTGEWDAHWLKASYIHDEVNLGATSPTGELDETMLQSVERRLSSDEPDAPATPEGVSPAATLD